MGEPLLRLVEAAPRTGFSNQPTGFVTIPRWICRLPGLSASAVRVLSAYIQECGPSGGTCKASNRRIGHLSGSSLRTVQRAVAELLALELIERLGDPGRPGEACATRLCFDPKGLDEQDHARLLPRVKLAHPRVKLAHPRANSDVPPCQVDAPCIRESLRDDLEGEKSLSRASPAPARVGDEREIAHPPGDSIEESPTQSETDGVLADFAAIFPHFAESAARAVGRGECTREQMAEALELARSRGGRSWSYVARCLETVKSRPALPPAGADYRGPRTPGEPPEGYGWVYGSGKPKEGAQPRLEPRPARAEKVPEFEEVERTLEELRDPATPAHTVLLLRGLVDGWVKRGWIPAAAVPEARKKTGRGASLVSPPRPAGGH